MSWLPSLFWGDVDPATHPFDESRARAVTSKVIEDLTRLQLGATFDGDELRRLCYRDIERALLRDIGAWSSGWRWNRKIGGPIDFTPSDGFDEEEAPTSDRLLFHLMNQAIGSLRQWRGFLEEVATVIGKLCTSDVDRALENAIDPKTDLSRRHRHGVILRDIERAATHLMPLAIRYTDAPDDEWKSTLHGILYWYLDRAGYDHEQLAHLVRDSLRGHFKYRREEGDVTAASQALAEAIAKGCTEGVEPIEAIARWMSLRRSWNDYFVAEKRYVPLRVDGHRRFVDDHDRNGHRYGDPTQSAERADRADRMEVALDMCRAWAASDEPLTFEVVASWQATVLGSPSATPFRAQDLYAKSGRERYAAAGARERFAACLAEANDSATWPLAIRAGRAYLDVCFFRPFPDGNARAARLVLDALLTRDGFGLHTAEPLFVLARAADDHMGHHAMVELVELLMGPVAASTRVM